MGDTEDLFVLLVARRDTREDLLQKEPIEAGVSIPSELLKGERSMLREVNAGCSFATRPLNFGRWFVVCDVMFLAGRLLTHQLGGRRQILHNPKVRV